MTIRTQASPFPRGGEEVRGFAPCRGGRGGGQHFSAVVSSFKDGVRIRGWRGAWPPSVGNAYPGTTLFKTVSLNLILFLRVIREKYE